MAGPAVESWTVYGQGTVIIELPVGTYFDAVRRRIESIGSIKLGTMKAYKMVLK